MVLKIVIEMMAMSTNDVHISANCVRLNSQSRKSKFLCAAKCANKTMETIESMCSMSDQQTKKTIYQLTETCG